MASKSLAFVALLSCLVSAASELTPIREEGATEFSSKTAVSEVDKDIKAMINAYDRDRGMLMGVLEEFNLNRYKDAGIRKIPDWGIALGRVYELDGIGRKDELVDRLVDTADMLLTAYKEHFSYVEQSVIRGWPMLVDPRDSTQTFESFNYGHIAMCVAWAAKALAKHRGEHQRAAKVLMPVLGSLKDNFLTDDPAKSKLDNKGRVVYVPKDAPVDRKLRHMRVTQQDDQECLNSPQAYNHGLMAARAAMMAREAMSAIDWDKAAWGMDDEWSITKAKRLIDTFILDSGRFLKHGMVDQPGTGTSKWDMYPGPSGSEWVIWNYRDYTKCDIGQGTYKDRPEDIAHATYETNFVNEFRRWAYNKFPEASETFSEKDVHKMIVTFLNRVVADYDAPGGKRFACDITGVNDDDDHGWNLIDVHAWKQCGGSRKLPVRAGFAPGWLVLATSIRPTITGDHDSEASEMSSESVDPKRAHCDVMRMVKTILPLVLPGDEFDDANFHRMTSKWASESIEAKYYWHYFQKGIRKHC